MTWQIGLVLGILVTAVVLFVTEKLRVDVVALLVLVSLAVTGLVEPREALAGFSNPAVITIWAVFILSGGLTRTGVANLIGHRLLSLAGASEVRLMALIMVAAALMSAFMNNVGVTALLLPVVMDLARKTGTAPSKLLLPLAYSSLLGGLLTLIGTPPNILVSAALQDRGHPPFEFFDFTAVGGAILVTGVLYMVFVGRHMLPQRDLARAEGGNASGEELSQVYSLDERLFALRVPEGSTLADKTLGQSRLGSALRLNVLAILRGANKHLAPQPDVRLEPGDRLLVAGRPSQTAQLLGSEQMVLEASQALDTTRLVSERVQLARVTLMHGAELIGHSPRELRLRRRGLNLLALRRRQPVSRREIPRTNLALDDVLLVQGSAEALYELREDPCCEVTPAAEEDLAQLEGRLLALRLPAGSRLARGTLAQSRLGDAFEFNVLGVVRDQGSETEHTELMPGPDFALASGDLLLVEGDREAVEVVRGLQGLRIESDTPALLHQLESEQVGMAEVTLSPHTHLTGKTLQELNFRDKFGLQVIAVWRGGRRIRSNLRDQKLQLGDGLLVYGPRDKLRLLAREPDFLVLTEEAQEVPKLHKAPLAVGIMVAVVGTALLGWLPIYIAGVAGAAAMVVTGCLTMDEAYREIEWRAVFLIAGMLPLGVAMESTGAAAFLARAAIGAVGDFGPLAVIACLFLLTALCAQTMPTAAVAVLLAPIAFDTAEQLALSPEALLMTVAMSASASFMSPVAHPANVLVMGPGGYRFTDYIRIGLPLTLLILVVVLVVLPIFWPLYPEAATVVPPAAGVEGVAEDAVSGERSLDEATPVEADAEEMTPEEPVLEESEVEMPPEAGAVEPEEPVTVPPASSVSEEEPG